MSGSQQDLSMPFFPTTFVYSKKPLMVQSKDPVFGIKLLPNFRPTMSFVQSTQILVYLQKKGSFCLYMLMICY